LPIYAFREQIIELVKAHVFTLITGETGSGKSTQLAQFLIDGVEPTDLKMPYGSRLKVVVTQPRRVAAIQMAQRVAHERQCPVGQQVGYTIRFEDRTDARKTRIKYVTDGILVRECLIDPDLNQYGVVILDEAHERSLNTDILFTLVKRACLRRKGTLRLIVTSATLKTSKIS